MDDVFGARPADRLAKMRAFLKRLDTELPQVIVEALEEAARAVRADVAAIFEVRGDVLNCAFSTDPSLLELRVEKGDEMSAATGARDIVSASFYAGDSEWLLVFGERAARLNQIAVERDSEIFVDIFTQLLRQHESGIDARSFVDHVTGVPDRRATINRLNETASAARRNGGTAALLFLDLNGFKGVNDSFGHAHGDAVLRTVASTLRDALRANEFVGRLGGDEFAVILPVVRSAEEATSAARRLADGVRALAIEHGLGTVSLSVGVAFYPEHANDVEEWLHHADIAMYQAKRQRESYCVFDPSDSGEQWTPLAFEVEERYSREFLLCFQPIFDVESGTVVAAEALLRSLHPQDGVQSAFNTMEAARARRSIEQLDAWVVRRALACAGEWRALGVERIHVNVGNIGDASLNAILRAVSNEGYDPSMLALELDWARFNDEYASYHGFAEGAERCGIGVGLDAFGETPLDLAQLERLPIRFVKPSHVLLPSGGAQGKGMNGIVALSRVYGWDVVATRVATAEDRAAIRGAGVKFMQGFAVAQPMTAIDFNQWMESSPRIALVS
jgi:diguanylate cyclase